MALFTVSSAQADQPTPYLRQHNFTDHTQNYPDRPQDGGEIDDEYNAIKTTLDQTLFNLGLIQRDDGELQNQSVGVEQLKPGIGICINQNGSCTDPINSGIANIITVSDNTCTHDVTAEIEAFAVTHNGYVTANPGDCFKIAQLGAGISDTSDLHLLCPIPGACTLKYDNTPAGIKYWPSDTVAYDSKTIVSAIGTGQINKDDVLQRLSVSDVTGYHVGDYVKIMDSVAIPNRLRVITTITNIVWDGSKCVVTTASAHGFSSNSRRAFLRDIVGTGSIAALQGADNLGRLYNATILSPTSFSLQALDNVTDTSAGTNLNCSSGAYSSGGTVSNQNGWASEANRVAGIDTLNNYIYLTHRLQLLPLYVQQPVLYRYTEARKFSIDGFRVESDGDVDNITTTVSDAAIDVMSVPEARFENLTGYNTWDAFIIRRSSPASLARNLKTFKLPNRGTYLGTNNIYSITNITRATQAVFTFYNTSGATGGISSNTEIGVGGLPTGWTSIGNILYRVSDPSGSTCTGPTHTCTFKLKDTYGNYLNTAGIGVAFSGTGAAGGTDNVTGLGYTISDYGAAFGNIADGLTTWEGRHSFTTDGAQNTWNANLNTSTSRPIGSRGAPTYGTVTNIVSHDSIGRAMDTHEEVYGYLFDGIKIYYPERGPIFGSYEGSGGQLRGSDITVRNFYQRGGKQGIRIVANDGIATRHYDFANIDCEDFTAADNSDKCIEIPDWSAFNFKPVVNIDDMRSTGVATPLAIGKTVTVRLGNATFRDFDDAITCASGATLDAEHIVTDMRNPGIVANWTHRTDSAADGFNAVKLTSDVTLGGCAARVNDATNYQGVGSNKLTNFFKAGDTTATKYYLRGMFREIDAAALGASSLISTATTMTQLTDESFKFLSAQFQEGIQYKDEGVATGSAGAVNKFNCVGTGVACSVSGDTMTITGNGAGAGGGTFSGPGSSTDNAVILFNGSGGDTGKNSVVLINSGAVSGVTTLATSGAITAGGAVNKVTITAPATSSTLTIADGSTLATAGAHSLTLATSADSNVTMPTSGTLMSGANNLSELASVPTAWANLGNKSTNITLLATGVNLVVTNYPSTLTLLGSASRSITKFDLTNYTKCRLVGRIQTGGTTSGVLKIMYLSGSFSGTITNYFDLGTSEISVPVTNNDTPASNWIDLAAGAKGDVFLAPAELNGDNTASITFGSVNLQCY